MTRSVLTSRLVCGALLALWMAITCALAADASAQTPEQRASALVAQMTQDEKLDFVAGGPSGFGGVGVPRLGIPPLTYRDGPNGIGEGEQGVTAFPNAVNIGAAWDPTLAYRYGAALGGELRAKGFSGLLGPTVEPLRNPLWGRAAETYGEDPFLNSEMAVPEVRGIQSNNVVAQAKHFAVNTQERGRFGEPLITSAATDVRVALRTLHEIYFPPFKAAVQRGRVASIMCSYIRINGTPACQNPLTLGILKGWGLRGFVGPDAVFAIRDLVAAANAGVDHFALRGFPPGGERAGLQAALGAGTVPQSRIDDAARRIVLGMAQVGLIDNPPGPAQQVASTPAHRALATEISAEASVLLQNRPVSGGRWNDGHRSSGRGGSPVLPLDRSDRKIAVIGYDAGPGTQIQEGGSPAVVPGGPVVTPSEGIRARAPQETQVDYALGTRGVVPLPTVPASVLTPSSGSGQGLFGELFNGRGPCCTGSAVTNRVDRTLNFDTSTDTVGIQVLETIPGANAFSGRWTGTLTPPATGEYRFSLSFAGNAKLFIDGKQVISGDTEAADGTNVGFPGTPPLAYQAVVPLTAGQPVPIRVEYAVNASIGGAVLKLGWQPPEPALRAAAVEAARKADVAVVFANDLTAETMDRQDLSLPGDQNQLIEAVAKANPRTVVVMHTASAVTMPWRDKVAAIVEAWYPGQQSGEAIAKTLFGDVDPSGRLPVTFPASAAQGPLANNPARYPGINNVVELSEGLFTGYRFFDANAQRPLFPFGHGLSYTSWSLKHLNVKKRGNSYEASVHVRNTGRRAGAQVVQLYVGFPSGAGEPPRQLKAFHKVFLGAHRSKTVTLELDRSAFEVFDETSNNWQVTPGTHRIYVGTSSRNLPLTCAVSVR